MRKWLLLTTLVALLTAGCAYALPVEIFYGGYTITTTPDDPQHPGQSGTITITGSSEYAEVNLQGTYAQSDTRPPTLTVHIWGTIVTPEASYEADRTFVFEPRTQRMVWRTIVAWIESIIAS